MRAPGKCASPRKTRVGGFGVSRWNRARKNRAQLANTRRVGGPAATKSTLGAGNTGLVYYGRRYYHPWKGRFLGRDPKEEAAGLNLYAFVTNNPINRWDVLGMYDGFLACGYAQAQHNWATAPSAPSAWVMGTSSSGNGSSGYGIAANGFISPLTGQTVTNPTRYWSVDDPMFSGPRSSSWLDRIQIGLDFAGMADPTPISDGVNAIIYGVRGRWSDAGISLAGAALPYAGDAAKLARIAKWAEIRRVGNLGETAVRKLEDIGEKVRIPIPGTDHYRIADGLNLKTNTLTEVKNLQSVSLTEQILDNITYAKAEGLTFQLYVRQGADLSGPLLEAVADGRIVLKTFDPTQ